MIQFQCPECKSTDRLRVGLPVYMVCVQYAEKPAEYLFEKATRNDVDWWGDLEDTALIECLNCDRRGGVLDFATEDWLDHRWDFLEELSKSPIDGGLEDLLEDDEQSD